LLLLLLLPPTPLIFLPPLPASLLKDLAPWGVEALVAISGLRGDKPDKSSKGDLKDVLTKYYDKNIKPGVVLAAAAGGGSTSGGGGGGSSSSTGGSGGGGGRWCMSPFDLDVDGDVILTGVRKPKDDPKKKKK